MCFVSYQKFMIERYLVYEVEGGREKVVWMGPEGHAFHPYILHWHLEWSGAYIKNWTWVHGVIKLKTRVQPHKESTNTFMEKKER